MTFARVGARFIAPGCVDRFTYLNSILQKEERNGPHSREKKEKLSIFRWKSTKFV